MDPLYVTFIPVKLVVVYVLLFQAKAAGGIKGLFHRNPKQASLDSQAAAAAHHHARKHPFGAHLLRRTASAPTRGQPKPKKGFPEIAVDAKDYSSEGASEERESEDRASAAAAASYQFTPPQHRNGDSLATNGAFHPEEGQGKSSSFERRRPMSEPLKRASRLCFHDPLDSKAGVFARVALSGSGRVGVSSNCITCVLGSKESPESERKSRVLETPEPRSGRKRSKRSSSVKNRAEPEPEPATELQPDSAPPPKPKSCMEAQFQSSPLLRPVPFPRTKARQTLGPQHLRPRPETSQGSGIRSCSVPRRRSPNAVTPAPYVAPDRGTNLCWQQVTPPNYGAVYGSAPFPNPKPGGALLLSDSSSCDSFGSLSSLELPPMLPPRSVLDERKRAVGTLQREMNALFALKMEELHHKSPLFFAGKTR